jgi:predicted TIM-barrel enzyme
VGLIDGNFRANLEETGMGYALEVDMIRLAHEKGLRRLMSLAAKMPLR